MQQAQPQAAVPKSAPSSLAANVPVSVGPAQNVNHKPESPRPQSFEKLVQLLKDQKEAILAAHLVAHCHVVDFAPPKLVVRMGDGAPSTVTGQLAQALLEATGERWLIEPSREAGQPTLQQQAEALLARQMADAKSHPIVKAVLDIFPEADIRKVTPVARLKAAS